MWIGQPNPILGYTMLKSTWESISYIMLLSPVQPMYYYVCRFLVKAPDGEGILGF